MDLIQANGQPHYGRFSELPKKIDYQAYQINHRMVRYCQVGVSA